MTIWNGYDKISVFITYFMLVTLIVLGGGCACCCRFSTFVHLPFLRAFLLNCIPHSLVSAVPNKSISHETLAPLLATSGFFTLDIRWVRRKENTFTIRSLFTVSIVATSCQVLVATCLGNSWYNKGTQEYEEGPLHFVKYCNLQAFLVFYLMT